MRNILHIYNNEDSFGVRLFKRRENLDMSVLKLSGLILERLWKDERTAPEEGLREEKIYNFKKTIYNWESNKTQPTINFLRYLSDILDCDYDFMMCKIDTPRNYIHDVKEVVGLSDETISILTDIYKESKPSIDLSKYPVGVRRLLKEEDTRRASTYKEKLITIDYIVNNSKDNWFLSYIYMYLFSNFIIDKNKEYKLVVPETIDLDELHIPQTIDLTDRNSGYTIRFGVDMGKEALLTKITYQLQKWKEEIENSRA